MRREWVELVEGIENDAKGLSDYLPKIPNCDKEDPYYQGCLTYLKGIRERIASLDKELRQGVDEAFDTLLRQANLGDNLEQLNANASGDLADLERLAEQLHIPKLDRENLSATLKQLELEINAQANLSEDIKKGVGFIAQLGKFFLLAL